MIYVFEDYAIDTERHELRRGTDAIAVEPQVFDLLLFLIRNRARVVSKDDLIAGVWNGRIVSESTLSSRITAVRQAIGDSGDEQRLIRTAARRGFRFIGDVREEQASCAPSTHAIEGGAEQETKSIRTANQTPARGLPDKPSIAVLPFTNLSGDPKEDYFSDGITEDIITELSRFSELFVIARNSSFRYKGESPDIRRVGRELGVRYVLEGSVRRAGDRVRITGQLVDAVTGAHRWAERYDRSLEDALALQDEVARNIVAVLAVHVKKAEIERVLAKPPAAWQAYDCYLRAIDRVTAYHASYDKEALFSARQLLQQALTIDPTYARAYATLSSCYMSQWVHRWDDDCPWAEALDRCYQSARESVRLAPELPEAHIALGQALTFLRQHEAAVAAVERATALNPNMTSFRFAYVYVLAGEAARAAQLLKEHMRLDPFYEPNAPAALGFAYYMLGRYQDALPLLQEAVSRAPAMAHGHYTLAQTYARLDDPDKARAEVEIALRLEPWYRISQSLTARYFKRPEDTEHLVGGLRKAGFPE